MSKGDFNKYTIKLHNNFIEITLQHGCSPVDLHHIFRTPFPKNTSEVLFLMLISSPYQDNQQVKNNSKF